MPPRPSHRLGFAIVRGRSMLPTLREGDRLLVRYGGAVRPGRLVLARFADGTLAIKRALERRTTTAGLGGWWLASDNPDEGVDSRHRGPVGDRDVLAVVLGRVWPLPPWPTRHHRSRSVRRRGGLDPEQQSGKSVHLPDGGG